MTNFLSNGLHDKVNDMLLKVDLDVEFVKKITLELVIGQQMKEEGHDQNYQWFLRLTFNSFAS